MSKLYACRQEADISIERCSIFVKLQDGFRVDALALLKRVLPPGTIIRKMARGWESKSVEAQQSEANEKPAVSRPKLTAEAAARLRELEALRLSRQRVLQQLERAANPRHRLLLENELADLDQKLAAMTSS